MKYIFCLLGLLMLINCSVEAGEPSYIDAVDIKYPPKEHDVLRVWEELLSVVPVRNVTTQKEDTKQYNVLRTLYDIDCKKKRYKMLYIENLFYAETLSKITNKDVMLDNLSDETVRWHLITDKDLTGYFLYKNLCTGIRE